MNYVYGIVHAKNGEYIVARAGRKNGAKDASVTREVLTRLPHYSLLHTIRFAPRRMICAVDAVWTREAPGDDFVSAAEETGACTTLRAWCRREELEVIAETFSPNCTSVVGDDGYLATLVRTDPCCSDDSFIAVFRTASCYRIGIILQGRLRAGYTLPPASDFDAHMGRIQRYWAATHPDTPLPYPVYCIGPRSHFGEDVASYEPCFCDPGLSDPANEEEAAAMGAACAAFTESAAVFAAYPHNRAHRRFRTAAFAVSAALICSALLGITVAPAVHTWQSMRVERLSRAYRKELENNKEIHSILSRTEDRARKVLQLESMATNHGSWAALLDTLAYACPQHCYIEKLESMPPDSSTTPMGLVCAGWTTREASITEFIGALQRIEMIRSIRLVSMNRLPKKESTTRFTLQCHLHNF